MKKLVLATVAVFVAVAANAAWNQECFYGKCCKDGMLVKECVKKDKFAKKGCKCAMNDMKCMKACKAKKCACPKMAAKMAAKGKPCPCAEKAAMKPAPAPAPVAAAPAPAPVVAAAPVQKDTIAVGRTARIAGSNFASNSYELSPGFERYLKTKAGDLKRLNFVKVIIIGYTDNTGTAEYNKHLSEQRAKAVADTFIKEGVPAEKVSYSGKGMENPVADNKTKEGRAENRRVEIEVK